MKTYTRFHTGEVQVQAEAGVNTDAYERMSIDMMLPELKPNEAEFVSQRTFSFAGSVDADGRPWASPLFSTGDQLFTVQTPTQVLVAAAPATGDPLRANVEATGELGVLYFDSSTRRRSKSIGKGLLRSNGTIGYEMTRNFGLCPKYIFKRTHVPMPAAADARVESAASATALAADDIAQLQSSDTIFFASFSPHGADVTHRGGQPGFVEVADGHTLIIPDYFGNGMFNTFGNLVLDDRLGITDVDFETGRTIHMTGRAEVQQTGLAEGEPQRRVVFSLEEVIVSHAAVGQWVDVEPSRYSPAPAN